MSEEKNPGRLYLTFALVIGVAVVAMAVQPGAAQEPHLNGCAAAAAHWYTMAGEAGDGLGSNRAQYLERGGAYERLHNLGAACADWMPPS